MMMERMPEDINLMAWVQDKISKSEHMMDAAYDYMMNKYSNASDLHNKEQYASLWENIQKKRERIKRGSGEKMRKKARRVRQLRANEKSKVIKITLETGYDSSHEKRTPQGVFMKKPYTNKLN